MTRRELGYLMMAAGAKEAAGQELKAYLQEQIDAKVIPGAKVLAHHRGTPLLELYLGTYCDQHRRDNPVEASAIHPLASVSKMVTATAVVMAWQDGLIDLDAPVSKYIPDFAAHGKEKITIRQCLTHTAGIPTAIPGKWMDTDEHWNETLSLVCAKELEWEPGSRTLYHGSTGPMVAAATVRRQLGGTKSWHAICKERIFDPLGLASFSFELPPPEKSVVLEPPPEDLGQGARIYRGSVNNPGGGLMGNLADMVRFLRFHTRGGVTTGGKRLLGERHWTEMHTNQFRGKPAPAKDVPGFESWGLGMMVRGDGPVTGGMGWFGIRDQKAPRLFSHVGISTAMAAGDPSAELEIAFLTTGVPATKEKATEMRCKVTNAAYSAIA